RPRAAGTARRPSTAANRPGTARARPGRAGRPAESATAVVPASVAAGSTRSPPDTSRRDSTVTVYVCAATARAAGTARTSRPRAAPSSTSSPRQAAITAGPAAVFFARRSYVHTVPASGSATARARRPPARAASVTPAAVSPAATPNAWYGVIRPDG